MVFADFVLQILKNVSFVQKENKLKKIILTEIDVTLYRGSEPEITILQSEGEEYCDNGVIEYDSPDTYCTKKDLNKIIPNHNIEYSVRTVLLNASDKKIEEMKRKCVNYIIDKNNRKIKTINEHKAKLRLLLKK